MRNTLLIVTAVLIGLVSAGPISKEDQITVTAEFFDDQFAVYTSQNDIISLTVPLNSINFDDNEDDSDTDITVFFVEGELEGDAVKEYKGLYRLRNGTVTKVLEDGTSATASMDDSKLAYFGAKSGVYVFNEVDKTVNKYGNVDDSVIDIAIENGTNNLYILTEDHTLYKVSEEGTKKELVENVKDAQKIVLDFYNNLYFYGPDKQPFVLTQNGVKKIEGLPETLNKVKLIRPPFVVENGALFVVDEDVYVVYENGTSETTDFKFEAKPTAAAIEPTLIQYYSYNKKIYEYNILAIILGEFIDEIKTYLEDKADQIQSIATRSRSGFRA